MSFEPNLAIAGLWVAVLFLHFRVRVLEWGRDRERELRAGSDQLSSEACHAAKEAKATAEDAHRIARNLVEKGGQECSRCS